MCLASLSSVDGLYPDFFKQIPESVLPHMLLGTFELRFSCNFDSFVGIVEVILYFFVHLVNGSVTHDLDRKSVV